LDTIVIDTNLKMSGSYQIWLEILYLPIFPDCAFFTAQEKQGLTLMNLKTKEGMGRHNAQSNALKANR